MDMYKLMRNIKLKKFFGASDNVTDICRPKSSFVPNINDPSIQVFENVLMRDIKRLEKHNHKPFFNLSRKQNEILKGIASDTSIIIKEADKGGALVILDKKDYMFELDRQLNETDFYKKIDLIPQCKCNTS